MQKWLPELRKRMGTGPLSEPEKSGVLELLVLLMEMVEQTQPDEMQKTSFSELIATRVLANRNLLAVIRQQSAELEALKRITYNLTSNLELQALLDAVATEAMGVVKNARDVQIYLYQNDSLRFGAQLDSEGIRNKPHAEPRANGITYTCARGKEIILVEDMRSHPLYQDTPGDWFGSIISIPLMFSGSVIGVMNMARWNSGPFYQSEQRLLKILAEQAAIAIMNARLHEAVAMQALSDTLTGLPNRRALDRRLESEVGRASRYGRSFGLLMMDLDGFKAVNDTWGHAVGDQVLHDVARFLASSCRASDFLARYGGDELTMIIPEAGINIAQQTAANIQERFTHYAFPLPDGSIAKLGISGGLAIYPNHGLSATDILRAADEALYQAKRQARGSILLANEISTSKTG